MSPACAPRPRSRRLRDSVDVEFAFLGEHLAGIAMRNGWGGALVNGAVRDTAQLAARGICVIALGACVCSSAMPHRLSNHRAR